MNQIFMQLVGGDAVRPPFVVTDQPEVDALEVLAGTMTTTEKDAHNYLVSRLKYDNIWNKIDDLSTCYEAGYFKLKYSVTKNNIADNDTGLNADQYDYNNNHISVAYNDVVVSGTSRLVNVGSNQFYMQFLNPFSYLNFFISGNAAATISHNMILNTKRSFVFSSNQTGIFVSDKNGVLGRDIKGNVGTFTSENITILDVTKLNFYAIGTGLTDTESVLYSAAINEFNNLIGRTGYDENFNGYMFVGDSITWGYQASLQRLSDNFPKYATSNRLGKTNASWNAGNIGVSGSTLAEWLVDLQNNDDYGLKHTNTNAENYMVVCLGTNDFLQSDSSANVKAMLDTYLGLLVGYGWKPVIMSINEDTTGDAFGDGDNYRSQAPIFNAAIFADVTYTNGVRGYGTINFNENSLLDDTTSLVYYQDGLHPTNEGQKLLGVTVADKLTLLNFI